MKMASRVLWLCVAGGVAIAGLGVWAMRSSRPAPVSVTATVPKVSTVLVRSNDELMQLSDEVKLFLDAAHKAEAVTDPLQRCLAYPDPPGVHWSANVAAAYCHYMLDPSVSLNEARDLIQHGRATQLEARLAAIESAQVLGEASIDKLDATFNIVFFRGSEEMRGLIDAWKRQSPDNAFALAASGTAYIAQAQDQRGSDFADQTPKASFQAMHRLLDQARTELDRAVQIDPKLTVAYAQMLQLARMDSDDAYAISAAKHALAMAPASYAVYARLITMSEPRCGGSVSQMDRLIDLSQQHVSANPLLRILRSQRGGGQDRVENCPCDPFREIDLYRKLFAEVPTVGMLMSGGWAAQQRGNGELSLVYRSQLLRFNPNDDSHREARGLMLVDFGRAPWALEEGKALVKKVPGDENAYVVRGAAYRATGDGVHAAADFEQVLRMRTDDEWTLVALGDVYVNMLHDWDKGWTIADRLILKQDPEGWLLRASIQKEQPRGGLGQTVQDFTSRFAGDPSRQYFVDRMHAITDSPVRRLQGHPSATP